MAEMTEDLRLRIEANKRRNKLIHWSETMYTLIRELEQAGKIDVATDILRAKLKIEGEVAEFN